LCACGCGVEIPIYAQSSNELRRYKNHHQRIGLKHSEYSRKKMSVSQHGKKAWNEGKHYKHRNIRKYSNEGRKKMSEAAKRKYQRGYKQTHGGHPNKLKGKKMTEQQKKNYFGRKHSIDARLKMSLARSKVDHLFESKLEIIIQDELNKLEIPFKKHRSFYIRGFNHQVDIFLEPNVVIECDGDYWHSQLIGRRYKNYLPIKRDYIIDCELEKQGMKVIRLWEYDIKNNLEWCMRLITSIQRQ